MTAGQGAEEQPFEVFLAIDPKPGEPEKFVGRIGTGDSEKWALAERQPDGRLKIVSPYVDVDLALRGAAAVLAGDTKTLTHPQTKIILALGIAAMAASTKPTPEAT